MASWEIYVGGNKRKRRLRDDYPRSITNIEWRLRVCSRALLAGWVLFDTIIRKVVTTANWLMPWELGALGYSMI